MKREPTQINYLVWLWVSECGENVAVCWENISEVGGRIGLRKAYR